MNEETYQNKCKTFHHDNKDIFIVTRIQECREKTEERKTRRPLVYGETIIKKNPFQKLNIKFASCIMQL